MYEPLSLTTLLDGPTEINWVVEPFVPPTSTILLAGHSGVGKTWLSLDLALSIAGGRPWLGRFPVRQGPVLVVDEENSELLLRTRLLKLLQSHRLDPKELPLFFLVGQMVNLSPEKPAYARDLLSCEQLLKTIHQIEPILVIFDSLTRCHRSNENSANEMAAVFANVKHLVDITGTSCLFNHHFRKSGGGSNRSGDRIRGSTDIRAFCDVTLLVDDRGGGCAITHDKSRWSEPIPSFNVDFQVGEDAFALSYAGERKINGRQQVVWDHLEKVLAAGPLSRKDLLARCESVCAERLLDRVLKQQSDLLCKHRIGKEVFYSLVT